MKGLESYTEEQAINITIEHGYNGSEFETAAWKQRKCLKPDRTLDGLVSKLQTIYNHVEVSGSGKKRKYILNDKKDQVSERKLNYKGTLETEQDKIMKEYIFNHLLSYKSNFNKSYKGWAKLIGFIEADSLPIEGMINEIKNLHYGFPMPYNPKEVVSVFINTLNKRSKDVVEKSFQRLEKENRIKVTEIYNIKYLDGSYKTITELEYNTFIECIKEYLETLDTTYYAYSQSLTSLHKSKKMKYIINKVDEYLADHFAIEYFFKSFKVKVTDKTIHKEVTKEEFKAAYFQRLIKLTQRRQERKNYNDSLSFWKRFYLYNTLALLKYINVKEVNELFYRQNDTYMEMADNFHIDMLAYNSELQSQLDDIRHIFGNN